MEKEIREIKKIPLREIFGKEAHGVTPWLANHMEMLSAAVDVPLAAPKTEVQLETLRPDIIAYTDPTEGEEVTIENQYDRSDSYHVGKLLSYAAYEKYGEGLSWNNTKGQVSCKIDYAIDNCGGYESNGN